jgi:hypothetical protein
MSSERGGDEQPVTYIPVQVPPCVASTAVGAQLAERMLRQDWRAWHLEELEDEWRRDVPVSSLLDVQRKLKLKRGPSLPRRCAVCGIETKQRCALCLAIHYCSHQCQRQDWEEHRAKCALPEPQVLCHTAVAVPDCRCFWNYQKWLSAQTHADNMVGIVIMARKKFAEMYGPDAELRTVLSLSLRGRPHCFMSKAFAAPGSASASGPVGKSEPLNVVPGAPPDSAPGAANASDTVGESAPLNVAAGAPCDSAPGHATVHRACVKLFTCQCTGRATVHPTVRGHFKL